MGGASLMGQQKKCMAKRGGGAVVPGEGGQLIRIFFIV